MGDEYAQINIEVLKGLEAPIRRPRGHVIEVDGNEPEQAVPDTIMRTVYLTSGSDAVLRQMAAETHRTRSDLVGEVLERGMSTTSEDIKAARVPFDTVMRIIHISRRLDGDLRAKAGATGMNVQGLIQTLVDLGARPLFDRLSDTTPPCPGSAA